MKKLLTTAAILICFIANSQCIKGDCDDGALVLYKHHPSK